MNEPKFGQRLPTNERTGAGSGAGSGFERIHAADGTRPTVGTRCARVADAAGRGRQVKRASVRIEMCLPGTDADRLAGAVAVGRAR